MLQLNRKVSTSVGISVIVVIAILTVGILTWQYLKFNRETVLPPIELLLAIQKQVDTSSWKTYRNEKYGFEFTYPENWQLSVSGLEQTYPYIGLGNPIEGLQWFYVRISILPNPERMNAESFAKNVMKGSHEDFEKSGIGVDLSKVENYPVLINDNMGYTFPSVFEYDQRSEHIFFANNTNIYQIVFPIAQENPNLSQPIENNAIVHKILSTFKFVESAADSECENLVKAGSSNSVLLECKKYFDKQCENNNGCGAFPCVDNKCLIKTCIADNQCPNNLCGLHATPVPGFCTTIDVL
jgi:hypothetical protein